MLPCTTDMMDFHGDNEDNIKKREQIPPNNDKITTKMRIIKKIERKCSQKWQMTKDKWQKQ